MEAYALDPTCQGYFAKRSLSCQLAFSNDSCDELSKSLESNLLSILSSFATFVLVVVSPIRAISSARVNSDISKEVTSGAITKSAGCTPTAFMLWC